MRKKISTLGIIAILTISVFIVMSCDDDVDNELDYYSGECSSHKWGSDVVTMPTCKTSGFTTQRCSECGKTQ